MPQTRRAFLQSGAAASALLALPPALMADALDSIKSVFAKVAGASAQEIAKDESLWAEVINAFALEPDSTDLASIAYGRAPRVVPEAVVDTFRRDTEKLSGGRSAP
jgi:hypothetical protein